MVRAPACRSRGRWFDSTSAISKLGQFRSPHFARVFLRCLEYNYLRLEIPRDPIFGFHALGKARHKQVCTRTPRIVSPTLTRHVVHCQERPSHPPALVRRLAESEAGSTGSGAASRGERGWVHRLFTASDDNGCSLG